MVSVALESLNSTVKAAASGHRTLAEKAFATLHEAIVTGVLEPGERLPIEGLAETFDMSPMPIREALRRLDSAGLVENVPHRGARVTELSIEDLTEVYEVRLALEPLAVRHGAERFTAEDRAAAEDALARLMAAAKSESTSEVLVAHTDFHFALYSAAGSRWLEQLIRPLWESSERYRLASSSVQRSVAERAEEHERMLDACVRHDPEDAEQELRNHLARTANAVSHSMGGEDLFDLDEPVAKPGRRDRAAATS
ncbi:MAG: GntR family transcriptional regulator [Solirubrobacterales bacterium]